MNASNICLICGEYADFTAEFAAVLDAIIAAEERVKAAVDRVLSAGSIAIPELQHADADHKDAQRRLAEFTGDKHTPHVCSAAAQPATC